MTQPWVPKPAAAHPLDNIAVTAYPERRAELESWHKTQPVSASPTVLKLRQWRGDLTKRRLRILDGDLTLECFGTPSETKRLHVFLSAGGGPLKDGVSPRFTRVSWHPWLDGVSVNIDDPTFFAYPGKLQTGWYLGTERQNAVDSVAAAISRIRKHYGIAASDVFIIGSSAGGTAALKVAAAVPGATAIAENPPIYAHERSSIKYFRRIGLDIERGALRSRNGLDHIFDHPSSRFVILQNAEDDQVMGELSRLLSERGLPMPGVGLNVNGSLSLYLTSVGTISPHHAFLSVTEFRSVLAAIGSGTPDEFRRGLLDAVHESLRSRSLLADRVSNLTGWSRVFDTLDVPPLAPPPPPTDSATTRIALRSNSAVIYRLRLAHQAKSLFMAVDVKPHLSSASHDELKRVAEAAGASLSAGAQGPTLSISGVPLSRVSDRLNSFVEATAPLFGEAH